MVEPEVPLKKKDQVAFYEEMARNLEAQLQAELIEEERLARQKLQVEEQGEITIGERSRLFIELMNRRKKHFAKLRVEEIRRKPPTKAQKRNQMSTYLKNMAGYKHSQLKSKSHDEIQKLFDKEMKRVNTFVDKNSEVVKGSKTRTEERSKRAGDELESDMSKKQKIDEHVEVDKDGQEEAEMKRHIEIVKDDEVAIDAIPLATKPPVIIEYKIDKDGRMGYFKLIRADGSLKRYSSIIKMLQGIDREDLETLWKLVKAKHKNTRPEEDYERVLWGDLKVMFKLDIKITTAGRINAVRDEIKRHIREEIKKGSTISVEERACYGRETLWELARLRLGKEEVDKDIAHFHKRVKNLGKEVKKVLGFIA
ncbi:hypothetical protein Tco_1002464 [Tanacetum coccineum]|uniref:Uncharacterized protein n=1 Tax=Tanacetum coccineum TaxID=301880 RepID=A0ABQ5F6G1_9ASTR